MTTRVLGGLLLVAVAMFVVAGCHAVNKSNYDKIQNGMTVAEVEGILGKGTEQSSVAGAIGNVGGSAKTIKWEKDGKAITVTFVNDKVIAKSATGL